MAVGKRITDLEQTTSVSNGANYLVETAAGTMRIRHDDLAKAMGKNLKTGDLQELDTENKESFVAAINELQESLKTPFEGTDGIVPGKTGVVPAPKAEDNGKVLGSNGEWVNPSSGGDIDAENVKFKDKKNAEEKVGNIDGMTSDLNCENERIAASAVGLKNVNDKLGGYNFINNPTVIYTVSDSKPYSSNGGYVLADSSTGQELLENSGTYTSNTVSGNFFRIEGADTVHPFNGGSNVDVSIMVNRFAQTGSFSYQLESNTKYAIVYAPQYVQNYELRINNVVKNQGAIIYQTSDKEEALSLTDLGKGGTSSLFVFKISEASYNMYSQHIKIGISYQFETVLECSQYKTLTYKLTGQYFAEHPVVLTGIAEDNSQTVIRNHNGTSYYNKEYNENIANYKSIKISGGDQNNVAYIEGDLS